MKAKSESYFEGDTKKWQTFWVQDGSSSRSTVSKYEFSNQIGWTNVIAELIKNSREDGVYPARVSFRNVHIRTSATMAFVEADEFVTWLGLDSTLAGSTHIYTVLAYENKRWKIANQVRVDTTTFANTPMNREYELNSVGYDLLREKRIPEAISLFVLNVKLTPTSWNAYDSLGEAYTLAGDTTQAIANYEKSLELNPKNESGKAALVRLRQP